MLFYYVIALHFLWGVYAAARTSTTNRNVSVKKQVMSFLLNGILAPIFMVIAAIAEWDDAKSIREVFNK